MSTFCLLCKSPHNVVGLCVCFLSICWLGCNLFEEVEGLLTLLECLVFQMVQVN